MTVELNHEYDTTDVLTTTPEFETAMAEARTEREARELPIETDEHESLIVEHMVRLEKKAGRQIDERKMAIHLDAITTSAMTTERVKRGWSVFFPTATDKPQIDVTGNGSKGYVYSTVVAVRCTPTRMRSTIGQEFDNIVASMDKKAQLPAFRWNVAQVDGERYVPASESQVDVDPDEEVGYAPFELPPFETWKSHFTGTLFGMEDYIEIIYRALELAVRTNWRDRVNIALIGPPACGKSHLCKIIKSILGEEVVLEYDGTSTTMAGAQKELAEREEMPRILIIEEIEKAPESSLPWLLSVTDLRGEIRKTTARGSIDKNVKMIGICTVNSEEKFKALNSGALASRFALPLYFERATPDVLWSILDREVRAVDGGEESWIQPAIEFAEALNAKDDRELTVDPRKLIAICLTGREKLIDGSFQRMYVRTMPRRGADHQAVLTTVLRQRAEALAPASAPV